jgi:uncharacterized protein
MSSLKERIDSDLRAAMKNKEEIRLSTLRMLKSDMQYDMTKTGAKTLSDDEVTAIIKKSVKKRKDSIEQFTAAGRPELAAPEALELAILDEYLPAGATEAEISDVIEQVLSQGIPEGASAMGKVMGAVMAKLKEKNADGALVKQLVQKRLNV